MGLSEGQCSSPEGRKSKGQGHGKTFSLCVPGVFLCKPLPHNHWVNHCLLPFHCMTENRPHLPRTIQELFFPIQSGFSE